MLQSTVSLAADYSQMSAGDSLGLGGSVTLLGVLVVFLALVALIVITMLYPKITNALIKKSTAMKAARAEKKTAKLAVKEAAVIGVREDANISATVPKEEVKESEMDNQDLIAVITAAIAANMGTSSNGITIKSLRRSRANAPAWGREGRNEQVYNRF